MSGTPQKNNSLGLSLYLFMALFILTGFAKFTSEYFERDIVYPQIFTILNDYNRELVFALLLILLGIQFFKNNLQNTKLGFYWAPVLLHVFLCLKLLINGNTDWYISGLGAISLYATIYVCANATKNLTNTFYLFKFSLIMCIVLIVLVLYQYITVGEENMQASLRFFFFSSHPNHAGIMWAFCVVTMTFLLINNFNSHRTIKIICLISFLFFLILTGSRGSYISCLSGIAVLIFLGSNSKKNNIKIYFFIFVLFISLSIFASSYISEFLQFQADRGNTPDDVYTEALNSFLSSPIVGLPYTDGRPTFIENLLLSYMMSAGFIGIILCALFYVGAFSRILKTYRKIAMTKDSSRRYFLAIFIMMMTSSLFEPFQINFVTFGAFASIYSATYLS